MLFFINRFNSMKERIVIIFLVFVSQAATGQLFFNGNFKYFRPNLKPLRWYGLDDDHEFLVDTSVVFRGQNTMRVRYLGNMPEYNGIAIFQQLNISKWPDHRVIKASCYLSFLRGDTSNFTWFVNNNPCVAEYHNKYARVHIDTVERGPRTWIKFTLERDIDTMCNEIFIGFVAAHSFDFNITGWEMSIDGRSVADVPVYPKPLPDWKDKAFLQASVLRLRDINTFTDAEPAGTLKKMIGRSRVVALGEGTHGSREFNLLRKSIIEYLVDSCGFNTIVFEENPIPMAEASKALRDGALPVLNIVDSFFINVHSNMETVELLRSLSTRMSKGQNLQLLGSDMQDVYWAIFYLQDHPMKDPVSDAAVSEIKRYTFSDKPDWHRALEASGRLKAKNEMEDMCLMVLRECLYYQANLIRGRSFYQMPYEDRVFAFNYRDSCMALNTLHLLRNDPDRKVIIWNHNSHIRKLPDSINPDLSARYMGEYLADSIGEDYKAFALTTAGGTMRGAPLWQKHIDTLDNPAADCYEYYFQQMGYASFFWPLVSGHPAITENLRFRSIGMGRQKSFDSFLPQRLYGNYDGIYFIDQTTWSHPLPGMRN